MRAFFCCFALSCFLSGGVVGGGVVGGVFVVEVLEVVETIEHPDAFQQHSVFAAHIGDGDAAQSCAPCASDSVDVVVARQRHVEVDDAIDGFDIQAARCHIGADESFERAVAETFEFCNAQGLRHVAVQLSDMGYAILQKLFCNLAHALAAVAKHQHRVVLRELLGQPCQLGSLRGYGQKDFFDRVCAAPLRREIDMFCGGRETFDQARDRIVQRGAHQNRLASCGQQRADALDIGNEPHVQHAIGFVDHQHRDRVEHKLAASVQVQQSARRCNHDIGGTREGTRLLAYRHAADQQRVANPQVSRKGFRHLRGLHRKLARRVQHQRTRKRRALSAVRQYIEQRQDEGGGLAGASLCDPDEVAVHQDVGNRLRLNWGRA